MEGSWQVAGRGYKREPQAKVACAIPHSPLSPLPTHSGTLNNSVLTPNSRHFQLAHSEVSTILFTALTSNSRHLLTHSGTLNKSIYTILTPNSRHSQLIINNTLAPNSCHSKLSTILNSPYSQVSPLPIHYKQHPLLPTLPIPYSFLALNNSVYNSYSQLSLLPTHLNSEQFVYSPHSQLSPLSPLPTLATIFLLCKCYTLTLDYSLALEAHHVDIIEDEEEDEREIDIVIDLSWNPREQSQEKKEESDSDALCQDMKCQLEIDININPGEQEIEYPVSPIPSGDFHVPTDVTTHEEYESNVMEASFDKYIDWGHGTLDFMPDGRLTFYEESNSPARNNDFVGVVDDQYDYRDFDLKSVLQDVQSREDDVRTDMQAQAPAANNNNEDVYHPEDDYVPLWLF